MVKKIENVANLVKTRIGLSSISVFGDDQLDFSDHGTTSTTVENDLQKSPSTSYANVTATQLSDAVASMSSENVNNNNEWSTVSNMQGKSKSKSNHLNAISVKDIISAARKLSSKPTAGPDVISSFVVKDCIRVFAQPDNLLTGLNAI
ncbi:hypothetical protein HHI36_013961 [Cryptolaemus montrouzieri]|uniref:Uncharacterized protein n=1 Tax=Cryptolaemus montrouzieri TaxID=559131 RepID=A0ABD2N1B4_9CUCU